MQKKPHAKAAKDAKARKKMSFLQPNDNSLFGKIGFEAGISDSFAPFADFA